MIKAIIVDDEILIRKGLIMTLPWQKYGIEIVGEASNGGSALEFIGNNEVDLLITDITMPIMSGIELMNEVIIKYRGLVPWFLTYTTLFHMKDTLFALIIPNLLLNGFNVLIMRAFFTNNIQPSLIESACLDGAGEFRIYFLIVLPLSLPILAAIGLMTTLSYWNDWYNSLIFINKRNLVSLQYLMTKVLLNIQFLQSSTNRTSEMSKILSEMPSETIRMAMAIVGIGPILLAYPFFQNYFIKGLTIGAVKG